MQRVELPPTPRYGVSWRYFAALLPRAMRPPGAEGAVTTLTSPLVAAIQCSPPILANGAASVARRELARLAVCICTAVRSFG